MRPSLDFEKERHPHIYNVNLHHQDVDGTL